MTGSKHTTKYASMSLKDFVDLSAKKLGFLFKPFNEDEGVYLIDFSDCKYKFSMNKAVKVKFYDINDAKSKDESIFRYIKNVGKGDIEYITEDSALIKEIQANIFTHFSYLVYVAEIDDQTAQNSFVRPHVDENFYEIEPEQQSRPTAKNLFVYELKYKLLCQNKLDGTPHTEPILESIFFDTKFNILDEVEQIKYRELIEAQTKLNESSNKAIDLNLLTGKDDIGVRIKKLDVDAREYILSNSDKHNTMSLSKYLDEMNDVFDKKMSELSQEAGEFERQKLDTYLKQNLKTTVEFELLGVYKIGIPYLIKSYIIKRKKQLLDRGVKPLQIKYAFEQNLVNASSYQCPICGETDAILKIDSESGKIGCSKCVEYQCEIDGCCNHWSEKNHPAGSADGQCPSCDKTICSEHAVRCEICGQMACIDCVTVCSENCGEDSGKKMCRKCSKVCEVSAALNNNNGIISKNYAYLCSGNSVYSGKYLRREYVKKCGDCNKWFYIGDVFTVGTDETKNYCNECTTACPNCAAIIGKGEIIKCSDCGTQLCNNCGRAYETNKHFAEGLKMLPKKRRILNVLKSSVDNSVLCSNCAVVCDETGKTDILGKNQAAQCSYCKQSYSPDYINNKGFCKMCEQLVTNIPTDYNQLASSQKKVYNQNKNKISIFKRLGAKLKIHENNGFVVINAVNKDATKTKTYILNKKKNKMEKLKK